MKRETCALEERRFACAEEAADDSQWNACWVRLDEGPRKILAQVEDGKDVHTGLRRLRPWWCDRSAVGICFTQSNTSPLPLPMASNGVPLTEDERRSVVQGPGDVEWKYVIHPVLSCSGEH